MVLASNWLLQTLIENARFMRAFFLPVCFCGIQNGKTIKRVIE
ncbi:hypothetical protein imdm_1581 [gamma proteobacterium IMCC2047]|nr:hypothetical protein imdm_1581 [gamma proteobacterium IMCC2047]